MDEPKQGMYKHYKGGKYKVLAVANHSETLEKFVVYEALYATEDYPLGSIWIRPLEMFMEELEIDGRKVPRFEFVE